MSNPLTPGSLAGTRALVTGSSRGIGADTATYLAEAGASVAINYRNKEARALKLVGEIEAAGGTAIAIGADLTSADDVAAMAERIRESFGQLDLLVLNASGGMESGMAEDYAMRLNRDAQVEFLTTMRCWPTAPAWCSSRATRRTSFAPLARCLSTRRWP